MEEKNTKLEFHGGMFGLLIPFAILIIGIVAIALKGWAMPMAFWVPALAAMAAALFLSKKPSVTADVMVEGMSQPMVSIMIMAWFLAGIVAQIMKSSGLVEGLIWLSLVVGLKGALFPAITFICGSLLSTATGTALGTVIALTPIMYPVGVALGARPAVMAAAIVSAAYFGDNIAPVSDTTIASSYSQGVEVSQVVKSRLKYALVAAAIALVFFIIFGGGGSAAVSTISASEYSPKGLIMLVVPALLIVLMYKGVHLLVALSGAGVLGIILGAITGLLKLSDLLIVDMDSFSVGGIIVDGVNSLIDIAVFAMLLMSLVHLLEKYGFFEIMIEKLSRFTKTETSSELTVALINIVLNLLTVASTIVIVIEGPIAKKLLVEEKGISPTRSANILDAIAAACMCLIPYGFGPLLAFMFAGSSGAVVDFTVMEVALYSFHGWALLIVMLFAILTGWGRHDSTEKETSSDSGKVTATVK